ncbi:MAG TPA: AI-2E family transporter [Pirellulales bacterium]
MSGPNLFEKPFVAWTPRQVIPATMVVVLLMGLFWLAYLVNRVLVLAFVALVLSTAVEPLVARAERWRIGRLPGTILVYSLMLAVVLGGLVTIAPVLAEQVITVSQKVPQHYENLRENLSQSHSRVLRGVGKALPTGSQPETPAAPAAPLDRLVETFGYLGQIGWGVLAAMLTVLLAFYWSLEGDRSVRALLLWLPADKRNTGREVFTMLQEKLGAYIRGQSLLCVIVGSLALVAYLIIGLPQALALACMVGVLEAIPIFGPVLGAVPALLTALAEAPSMAIWVLVANTAIQQIENYVLVPRVMDRSVGINAIVTLLAIVAFGALIGPLGAILAIPLAAIVQTLLNRFVLDVAALETIPEGRTKLSRLRYEAQDLARDVRKQVRQREQANETLLEGFEDRIEAIVLELDQALAVADQPALEPIS